MLRLFLLGSVLCSASAVLAQSNATPSNQSPAAESAESAWLETMPAPTPPPLRRAATNSAPQDPARPVRISGGVMAAQLHTRVDPVYPPQARADQLQGSVVLSATIAPDGTVQNLQALSGPEPLRAAALEAVRQWTYKPFLLNGNPVTVLTTVTVNFHLPDPAPAQ